MCYDEMGTSFEGWFEIELVGLEAPPTRSEENAPPISKAQEDSSATYAKVPSLQAPLHSLLNGLQSHGSAN
jgi:hypothetical protein